jgi:hypothetical protein
MRTLALPRELATRAERAGAVPAFWGLRAPEGTSWNSAQLNRRAGAVPAFWGLRAPEGTSWNSAQLNRRAGADPRCLGSAISRRDLWGDDGSTQPVHPEDRRIL